MNAAITESFLKPKKTIDSDSVKQERKKVKEQSTINTEISTVSYDSEVLPEEAKATVQKTSNEDPPNSSKSKMVSNSQPIIITSTSISISLEENTANSYTTTVNPNNPNLNVLSATSSSVASSSTLKPKTNKGTVIWNIKIFLIFCIG